MDNAVYISHGFPNRKAYLESLVEQYDPSAVMILASLLGPSEDFDGLVVALEDSETYAAFLADEESSEND